jgi:D-sedoheptulose 7-phosphate isomerase
VTVERIMYGEQHRMALVDALDRFTDGTETATRWGATLAAVLTGGARLLTCGNGGSAAQAQHLTAELVGRYHTDRRPFAAIALHAETSSTTAIGNDYGVDSVFARQVEAHGRPGDVLIALSTSGASSNLLAAARAARRCGVRTWAMTGPEPNPLSELVDETLAVDAEPPTVQELHLVALHMLCASLDVALGVAAPSVAERASVGVGR